MKQILSYSPIGHRFQLNHLHSTYITSTAMVSTTYASAQSDLVLHFYAIGHSKIVNLLYVKGHRILNDISDNHFAFESEHVDAL